MKSMRSSSYQSLTRFNKRCSNMRRKSRFKMESKNSQLNSKKWKEGLTKKNNKMRMEPIMKYKMELNNKFKSLMLRTSTNELF